MASGSVNPLAYEPKHTLGNVTKAGAQAAGVGALVSTVQNALGSHQRGAAGFLTRTGGTIGFFTALGATFAAAEAITANTRQVDDPKNGMVGGCAAGFLAGVRSRSLPQALAGCAILGGAVGAFELSGDTLHGRDESREERRTRFFKQKPDEPTP